MLGKLGELEHTINTACQAEPSLILNTVIAITLSVVCGVCELRSNIKIRFDLKCENKFFLSSLSTFFKTFH